MNGNRIAVIDIETTGLVAGRHEIIEIGCVVLDGGVEVARKSMRVTPTDMSSADPLALAVNGYSREAWVGSMSLRTALLCVSQMCEGCHFAAFNATFDWSFLALAFANTGVKDPFHYHRIDVMSVAWAAIPGLMETPSLRGACVELGIEPEAEVHRAIEGAHRASLVLLACSAFFRGPRDF